jgi:hypothetical protein
MRRLFVVLSVVGCMVIGTVGPAHAAGPPYAESEVGTSKYVYADSPLGTAAADADSTADAGTGVLTSRAEASDSFVAGWQGGVVGPYYANANASAAVRPTRTLGPGEYVVIARFTDARAATTVQQGSLYGTPVGGYVQYSYTAAYTSLGVSCSGCSVSNSQYLYLGSTPATRTLVVAVTIPDGPARVVTATASLQSYAFAMGEGAASVEASATLASLSIFRGEEEV